jgi:hypothetical protein
MKPAGTSGRPSLARIEQTIIAATPSPEACRSAIAVSSFSKYASHSASSLRPGAIGRNFSGNGKARTDGFDEGDWPSRLSEPTSSLLP